VIVDVQGFRTPDFVPKEMAIFDGTRLGHYLFKPPFPFKRLREDLKREARWLERHKHGLAWSSGHTNLNEINNILQEATRNARVIYCKGKMKEDYLKKVLPSSDLVIDLLEETPALAAVTPECFFHKLAKCNCTVSFVKQLYNARTQSNM